MTKTPLAIVGAGPIGIDAALAAEEAGLDYLLLESGPTVGTHMREWGHVSLFSPWDMNLSHRMERRLSELGRAVPAGGSATGQEYLETVLEPLAASLSSPVRLGNQVVAIGRQGLLKHQEIGSATREAAPFRLIVRGGGEEEVVYADVVLDCTGSWAVPNAVGDGGVFAPGEEGCPVLSHEIPNPDEGDRWIGKRVLVVGSGHSAQTAIVNLLQQNGQGPAHLTWVVRRDANALVPVADDPLPGRAELLQQVTAALEDQNGPVDIRDGVEVDRIVNHEGSATVVLRSREGGAEEHLHVDTVYGLTGRTGDHQLYRQLQVHECYATSGPMKLAAALLGSAGSADCLVQESHGAESLANPEPNFYILGVKSYGRTNTFLMRVGWDQVTDVFASLASKGEVG